MKTLRNIKLFDLFFNTTLEGILFVKTKIEGGSKSEEYAISARKEVGTFPYFFSSIKFGGPNDYKSLFPHNDNYNSKEYHNLLSYINSNRYLRTFFDDNDSEYPGVSVGVGTFNLLINLIDRYIHTYGLKHITRAKFKAIYLPIENYLYSSYLSLDIIVPIHFVDVSINTTQHIDDFITIERMSGDFQTARSMLISISHKSQSPTIGMSTHSIVFKNIRIPKPMNDMENTILFYDSLHRMGFITLIVDNYFTALRLSTIQDLNYTQILFKPREWTFAYTANLPPLFGSSVDHVLSFAKNNYHKIERPVVRKHDIKQSSEYYKLIVSNKNNGIRIALERFNKSFHRENSDDAIIDLAIGFEVLLSDSQNEIAHKISTRVALLSKIDQAIKEEPFVVFKNMKEFYSVRSKIVHGTKNNKIQNEIIAKIGLTYLGMVIRLLLIYPQYQSVTQIEQEFIFDNK